MSVGHWAATKTCSSRSTVRQQGENAAVAIAAVEAFFGRELDHDLVQEGFATLRLHARFEVVSHAPLVILDVAHNPDAIRRAAQTLDEEFTVIGSRTVVIGMLAGRDPDATADVLADARPDLVVCTSLGNEGRSLDGRVLAAAMERRGLASEVGSRRGRGRRACPAAGRRRGPRADHRLLPADDAGTPRDRGQFALTTQLRSKD